ncbi:MAG: hypothetical protein ACFFBD_28470 [Candidatus Hodarchaeota archaeon]
MNNQLLDQINRLNTEELVKDILRDWLHIRTIYSEQIQKFHFLKQDKAELGQLAQDFYQKHINPQVTTQTKVVWDEGIFEQYFSILLFGKETYPLLAYPYPLLQAESLNPNMFQQILRSFPALYVDFELFTQIFWRERWAARAYFSQVDLKLLNMFFGNLKTQSSIGFPDTTEFLLPEINISKRVAQLHYQRLLALQILSRRSLVNYAQLGLSPLLKIYERDEVPSDTEMTFSIWESEFLPDKSLQLLVIPPFSSFWSEHSIEDVYILHSRCGGTNVNQFDGTVWNVDYLSQFVDNLTGDILSPQWEMIFDLINPFPLKDSDLRLLKALLTPERIVKHFGPRVGLKESGYIPKRLRQLRNAKVFQTYFQLLSAGLNERYYLLALGSENKLRLVYQFLCHLPRYEIFKAEKCIYAPVWLSSESRLRFLEACTFIKDNLDLEDFHYDRINPNSKSHQPDLLNLSKIKNKKRVWYSEVDW